MSQATPKSRGLLKSASRVREELPAVDWGVIVEELDRGSAPAGGIWSVERMGGFASLRPRETRARGCWRRTH